MSKLILCLFSLLICMIASAATRLALLGDNNTVDLLTVKLSEDSSLDLLERSQIEAVLKEHKIIASQYGSGELVKYFPHVDVLVVAADGKLIVFNAKNGFRLGNYSYKTSEEAIKLIQRSIAKKAIKDLVLLSVVSVRDVGIPKNLKPKISEFVSDLEYELSENPKIQFLERTYLEHVLKERDLTSKYNKLAASATLLKFEFEPGSDSGKVILRYAAITPNGKELFRTKIENLFKNGTMNIGKVAEQILQQLSVKVKTDTKGSEAERYYNEGMALYKSGSGKKREGLEKIKAAVALRPNVEKYRWEEIFVFASLHSKDSWDKKIPSIRKLYELCQKFNRDFSKSRKNAFDVFSYHSYINDFSRLSLAQMKELSELFDMIRPEMRAGMKRAWYPYDLTDGINSYKELSNYSDVVVRSNWPANYCDYRKWLKGRYEMELDFLRQMNKFVKQHPDMIKKVNSMVTGRSHGQMLDIFFPNYPLPKDKIIIEYLKQTDEYINEGLQSPVPFMVRNALTLKLMRDVVSGPRNKQATGMKIDEFLAEIDRRFPGAMKGAAAPSQDRYSKGTFVRFWRVEEFSQWWVNDSRFFSSRLDAYREKNNCKNDWERLARAIQSCDIAVLKKNIKGVQKYNYERMCKNSIANMYTHIPATLFRSDRQKSGVFPVSYEFLFNELHSAFEIETFSYAQIFGINDSVYLDSASKHGKELALLFHGYNSHPQIMQIGIMTTDGKISRLLDTPVSFGDFEGKGDVILRNPAPFAFNSEYFVIVCKSGRVAIYSRNKNRWSILKDISSVPVRSLLITSDKIYLLCSNEKRDAALMSCNCDGSDLKIHFSTKRNIPQNELDKLKVMMADTLVLLNDDLFFSITGDGNSMIWRYKIEEDKFDLIYKFPFTGHYIDYLRKQDKNLYFCTFGHGERLYQIKPEQKTVKWIFEQGKRRYKFDGKMRPQVQIAGGWQLQGPWLLKGKYLWSSHYTPAVVDIDNPKSSPLLLLPACGYIFDYNKDSVVYYGQQRYFIVKLKK